MYQALRCGWPRLNGRIVLHDQGVPRVTGNSLLVTSGMQQQIEQPWPTLWSEHSNAGLSHEVNHAGGQEITEVVLCSPANMEAPRPMR